MSAITWTTRLAVVTAALVILSAGILGYTALYDLFVSIGLFSSWLGIFFPLLFDLAEITAAVSVFNAKLQGEDDKFAWRMVILFTILGIVANIGHATTAYLTGKIDQLQVVIAIFATSLFPLSVALVTHLVKRVITRDITRRELLSSLADLVNQVDQKRQELAELLNQKQGEFDRLSGQIERAQRRLEEIKAETNREISANVHDLNAARQAKIDQRRASVRLLLSEGLTPADIANELAVTIKTIKRDISVLNGKAKVTQ
ncbi:MAG: DUF2637 domain-containing protein [Anaerolineae bacterium]|nr:DUF2637 domain-containing protein [Anaerolineae bacterium]